MWTNCYFQIHLKFLQMKKVLVLTLLIFSSLVFTQPKEEIEIQTTIESMFQNVFSDLDLSQIPRYFTEDFVLFEDGEITDRESITQMILNLKEQFESEENKDRNIERRNSFEFLKTSVNGNSAWIYYKNSAIFTLNGMEIAEINWLENAYLQKENKDWKIQFLHSSVVKESK